MIKVLHVLGSLNQGGAETWLTQVLRTIDRQQFQFDFCCLSGEPGIYAPEIIALGSQVYPCRLSKNLLRFNSAFGQVIATGHYNIVHSHVHHFSGYILWRAFSARVPIRIAHSHNAPPIRYSIRRRAYENIMTRLIFRYSSIGLAASSEAGIALFRNGWQTDPRWKVLRYGIDTLPFRGRFDRSKIRAEFSIPDDALVLGHIGRFTNQKNHIFLLQVYQKLISQCDNVWLLLVGDGELRSKLEANTHSMGLDQRVVFAGLRSDIPQLLASMDLFCMPSLYEGLPVALLEAQAAGLRCLCADSITSEVAVVPGAVRFFPLIEGVSAWAQLSYDLLQLPALDRSQSLAVLADSQFSIEQSVKALSQIYAQAP